MAISGFQSREARLSIFEHIRAHVSPGVTGLAAGGLALPDDEEFREGGLTFAPGAREGIFCGPGDPEEVAEAADRIYAALSALAAEPDEGTRRRLRECFREGRVRARIDAVSGRIADAPPPHSARLYAELRRIFLCSGHREEVKYALALMGGFAQRQDADLFHVIARHDEFTLYAAIALIGVTDDPLREWLDLLPHVDGWGRTELASVILRHTHAEEVRERLVRAGPGVGNAIDLAERCRLDEPLERRLVDDGLLAGGCVIVDELVHGWESPALLADYDRAGPAIEALLEHLALRPPTADSRRVIAGLQAYLTRGADRYDERTGEDRFASCGLADERLDRILAACSRYLAA